MRMSIAGSRGGFSLIEVVLAIGVLGVAVMVLLGVITPLLGRLSQGKAVDQAIDASVYVRQYIDEMAYQQLFEQTDQAQEIVFSQDAFCAHIKRAPSYQEREAFLPLAVSLEKEGQVYYRFMTGKQLL